MRHPSIARRQLLLGSLALAGCGGSSRSADDAWQADDQAADQAAPSDGIMRNVAPPYQRDRQNQPGGGYDPAIEARMRQLPIKFYMAHWCPVCRRARGWLDKGGYTVEAFDIDADEQASRYMLSVNPRGSIPMFEIDGARVIGFAPDMVRGLLRRAVERRMRGE